MTLSETQSSPGPLHFDATLHPHRSLSRKGFIILMAAISAVSFITGMLFFTIGAWPIPGFLGLDVALIYVAFKLNYQAARAHETVQLSDSELRISKVDARGRASSWCFEPYWVHVEMDDPPAPESQLVVASHGRRLVFGTCLSPEERADFAKALRAALAELKAPRL